MTMQYFWKNLIDHTIIGTRVPETQHTSARISVRTERHGQVGYTPEEQFLQEFHCLGDITDLPDDLKAYRIRMVLNDARHRELCEMLQPESVRQIPPIEAAALEMERAHLFHILDVQRKYWSERVEVVSAGEPGMLYAKHIPRVRPA